MLIIAKTTGEPVAFLGGPSAELDAPGAALDEPADVVAPAEPPVLAALDDDEPADELPHAATETAAIAHAPTRAPLLVCAFISTSLCCAGLRAPGRCLRPCTGKRPTACRRGEYTQLPRVYASH